MSIASRAGWEGVSVAVVMVEGNRFAGAGLGHGLGAERGWCGVWLGNNGREFEGLGCVMRGR